MNDYLFAFASECVCVCVGARERGRELCVLLLLVTRFLWGVGSGEIWLHWLTCRRLGAYIVAFEICVERYL